MLMHRLSLIQIRMGVGVCVSLCLFTCVSILLHSFLSVCIVVVLQGVLFYCLQPTKHHQCCLQLALINGADPNNSCAAGVPVLVLACQRAPEFDSMALSLLDQGADPNAVSQVNGLLNSLTGRLLLCSQDNARVIHRHTFMLYFFSQ